MISNILTKEQTVITKGELMIFFWINSKTSSIYAFSLIMTRQTGVILEGGRPDWLVILGGAGDICWSYCRGEARLAGHTGRGRRHLLVMVGRVRQIWGHGGPGETDN